MPVYAASLMEGNSLLVLKEQLNTGLIFVVTCSSIFITGLCGIQILSLYSGLELLQICLSGPFSLDI